VTISLPNRTVAAFPNKKSGAIVGLFFRAKGMVFDDWDLRNAMRIARKIPGVRRVVNDLEIKLGGE
jgi:hypothetical protein